LLELMPRTTVALSTRKNTSSVMPFQVPNTNSERNSKRYVLTTSVLRRWLRELLELKFNGISQSLVPLMSYTDNSDVTSHVSMFKNLALHRTYYEVNMTYKNFLVVLCFYYWLSMGRIRPNKIQKWKIL